MDLISSTNGLKEQLLFAFNSTNGLEAIATRMEAITIETKKKSTEHMVLQSLQFANGPLCPDESTNAL